MLAGGMAHPGERVKLGVASFADMEPLVEDNLAAGKAASVVLVEDLAGVDNVLHQTAGL